MDNKQKDTLNGKWISAIGISIMSHPKSDEILKLIRDKSKSKLTYFQIAQKIEADYGINCNGRFVEYYYKKNFAFKTASFYQYNLEGEEKMRNLLDEFISAKSDLEIARQRNKMDFKLEANLGKSFTDSYRHTNSIINLRQKVLELGSAVGYFPRIDFDGINNISPEPDPLKNNAIVRLLDLVIPDNPKKTKTKSLSKICRS